MWPRDAYVGQKVVCVDAGEFHPYLRNNEIYTVSAVGAAVGMIFIGCYETKGVGESELQWCTDRFRPLTERPNDAEAFVRKLKEACAPKQKEKERVPAFEGRVG